MVAATRSEETKYMDDIGMFKDATDEECFANAFVSERARSPATDKCTNRL